jgi:hypothetical protein
VPGQIALGICRTGSAAVGLDIGNFGFVLCCLALLVLREHPTTPLLGA